MNFIICLIVPMKMSKETKFADKNFIHHPNVPKFCSLMNMTSKSKNAKLAIFMGGWGGGGCFVF